MRYLLWHMIDQAADRWPEHKAIQCRGEAISYQELAEQSNRVAHLLIERGVNRGDRVGILMNKRTECAVAIYGIMKAGAAYVPLDPSAPKERHAFVAQDCGIRHLLSEPRKRSAATALAKNHTLETVIGCEVANAGDCLSIPFDELASFEHRRPPPRSIMEQDLAYVLYTSGSTGVPKGVMHSHRSGIAWAEVSANAYGLEHTDRISNYAPLHFDLSTLDYFAGALVGATTVMIPEEVTKVPASLAQLIADERLTIFYTVPLALTQLATSECISKHNYGTLRWLLFGGEQMPPRHLSTLMGQLPETRFCNVYGPTETNGCTHFVIDPARKYDAPVPIGVPYANVEALILGGDDAEVAPGEVGELVIRAPTLMRGYWGREDLNTTCSFNRKVLSGIPDRFHRTGDLVFKMEDGNIQFVGRKDRQIKSRGCRVDLDEIEAVIFGLETVSEAAVFAVADEDGHQIIEAAIIPAETRASPDNQDSTQSVLSEAELRKALRKTLPPYAVPVRMEIVKLLPRTSTGKVDRVTLAHAASVRRAAKGH